jgi:hypothetical protein
MRKIALVTLHKFNMKAVANAYDLKYQRFTQYLKRIRATGDPFPQYSCKKPTINQEMLTFLAQYL